MVGEARNGAYKSFIVERWECVVVAHETNTHKKDTEDVMGGV